MTMPLEQILVDHGPEDDRLQPIAILIPAYIYVSSRFLGNFINSIMRARLPIVNINVVYGVYTAMAMTLGVNDALKIPGWERLVVLETDMILPKHALPLHCLHDKDIVGSMYFQHAPPFLPNFFVKEGEKMGHPGPQNVKYLLDNPAMYKVHGVGMGCTSIKREVLENWDPNIPMWITPYAGKEWEKEASQGVVSHDVWFCDEANKQGREVWLDSSIVCDQLTEGWTTAAHYLNYHKADLEPKIEHTNKRIIVPELSVKRAKVGR